MLRQIHKLPFPHSDVWPAFWIWAPDGDGQFQVVQFTRRFAYEPMDGPMRVHVSADQRYKLYLDGRFIGLGPQAGDVGRWYFDTYDLNAELTPGDHTLTAVVWHNYACPPTAQLTVRPGFILAGEGPDSRSLSTGKEWRCRRWNACRTLPVMEDAFNIGSGFEVGGWTVADLSPSEETLSRDFLGVTGDYEGCDSRADDTRLLAPWRLTPRTIPALRSDCRSLGKLRAGVGIEPGGIIPPHSRRCLLFDHETLTIGYPQLVVSGGADGTVRLIYQEALQSTTDRVRSKCHRDNITGKFIVGISDLFHLDGRSEVHLEPLWWRCWRYLQVEIETAGMPLTIDGLQYRETGYPLSLNANFDVEADFIRLVEPGFRTLQLCAGETYMDCPYYEQLQYVADTRLQALCSYVLSGDDRLARQALEAFDRSRLPSGFTQARYPARVAQVIPVFSLWFIAMLEDFLMWRGDLAFVRRFMRGVAAILYAFGEYAGSDGLLGKVPGWMFVDWVRDRDGWERGVPPGASEGRSYLVSFLYLYALQRAEHLWRATGVETEARACAMRATHLQDALRKRAFHAEDGLFVDEPTGVFRSQHTNIMALLTGTHEGVIEGAALLQRLIDSSDMAPTSHFFSFYLFEAMYVAGRGDLIWSNLRNWHAMLDQGLTTFPEGPEPTRSDCHGWSAHPLYHYFASVLGVRPAEQGCTSLSFRPPPPSVDLPPKLGGTFMIPSGPCDVFMEAAGDKWKMTCRVPEDIEVLFASGVSVV